MTTRQLLQILDDWAPYVYQESYDNSGLLIGDLESPVTGVLVSLDLTPGVITEAISRGANTIITHHPIIFSGLKKITTGTDIVQNSVIQAIRAELNIISLHTNLDNILLGVNQRIGNLLGLEDLRVLYPKVNTLSKLTYYVPTADDTAVKKALYNAGAGEIGNYAQCSYTTAGQGTYTPLEGSDPYQGSVGTPESADELRVEMVFASHKQRAVEAALESVHPYETVAYDITSLHNTDPSVGSGMIGKLPEALDFEVFLSRIKEQFNMPYLRHTPQVHTQVQSIAYCGGAGAFLIPTAKAQRADLYLTADLKYHDFFSADGVIDLVDMGHFEMEQYTSQLIVDYLSEKKLNFAIHLTETLTNPINYF